jgi:hypothetical protein
MSSADVDWWRLHPLWLCRYRLGIAPASYAELLAHLGPMPHPWSAPTLVQYTGDGVGPPPHTVPGLERGADLNVFGGTRDQLAAVWGGAAIDPGTGMAA